MIDIKKINKDIEQNVYENEEGDITGQILQDTLKGIVQDIATPSNKGFKEAEEKLHTKADRVELASTDEQVLANTEAIAELSEANKQIIAELNDKQKKIAVIELDNWGGERYTASKTSSEINALIQSGRDVVIFYDNKIYRYAKFEQSTSYFRFLNVEGESAINEQIEVHWNGEAYLKKLKFDRYDDAQIQQEIKNLQEGMIDVEYKFNATPLFKAMEDRTPINTTFFDNLKKAIEAEKDLYIHDVNGESIVHLDVIFIKKDNGTMTFSAFNGQESYMLILNTKDLYVSLDTERIGAYFEVFNNTSGNNVFNLSTGSSNIEIIEVFTTARNEEKIPETGDIFNTWENSNLAQSGIVISKTEDEGGINLQVLANDVVKEYSYIIHLQFDYNPSRGMESLKLTAKNETIVDWSLLAHDKQYTMSEGFKRIDSEINCYNISAISGSLFGTMNSALEALNAYLLDKPKNIGLEMIYVGSDKLPKKFIFVGGGGGFTNPTNWKPIKF